jgi:hypothetical protein
MSYFSDECHRLARKIDPNGTKQRDWDLKEGRALKRTLEALDLVFSGQNHLRISTRTEGDTAQVLVSVGDNPMQSAVTFHLKPTGENVAVWPTKAANQNLAVGAKAVPFVIEGKPDPKSLEAYLSNIFGQI